MAGGMIGTGQAYKKSALQSMQRYASLDEKLKADEQMANRQLEAAEKQQNMSMGAAAGGMMGGALAGSQWGAAAGPYGMLAGALIGGIAGSLF